MKDYEKKLKASYFNEKARKLIGLKEKRDKTVNEIHKDFIFSPSLKEKLMGLFGKNYLQVCIIMPNGVIKKSNEAITSGTIIKNSGEYVIELKSIVKFGGKQGFIGMLC